MDIFWLSQSLPAFRITFRGCRLHYFRLAIAAAEGLRRQRLRLPPPDSAADIFSLMLAEGCQTEVILQLSDGREAIQPGQYWLLRQLSQMIEMRFH